MDLMRFRVFAVLSVLLSASLYAQTVFTFAGSGAAGLTDGAAPLAQFHRPTWIDVDPSTGAIYVVDRANHRLRRIVNGEVTTLPVKTFSRQEPPSLVEFDFGGPFGGGIAIEPVHSRCGIGPAAHGMFIANSARHQLLLIADYGYDVSYAEREDSSPVIGTGTPGAVDEIQTQAQFNNPGDITLSWDFSSFHTAAVYIADTSNHSVRRIRMRLSFGACPQPYFIDTLASGFNSPRGVAAGPDGSVYVADTGNHAIRRIAPDGTVTTVVAEGLNSPSGIDVNALGEIFIADTGNYVVRKWTTDGRLITIAGTPNVAGYLDGPALSARFSGPIGVRLHGNSLYIADTANNVIRKLNLEPSAPRRRAARH